MRESAREGGGGHAAHSTPHAAAQLYHTHELDKGKLSNTAEGSLTHHTPLQKILAAEPLGKGASVSIIRRGTAFKRDKRDMWHTQRQTGVSRGVRAVSNTSQRGRTSSKCRAAVPVSAPEGVARHATF